jgi:hypothetical protein
VKLFETQVNLVVDQSMDPQPCSDRQPNLPVFQTVSQDVSKPLKAIFIELCAGSAKLKAACAQAGLTAVAVDQISNRHTTSPCNESGSLW